MDKRVKVKEWNINVRNVPPQIFINLDASDIGAIPDTVATIVIKRNDGKIARINLSLAQLNGKVKAAVNTVALDKTIEKTLQAKFCWTDNNGEIDYPPNHPARRN